MDIQWEVRFARCNFFVPEDQLCRPQFKGCVLLRFPLESDQQRSSGPLIRNLWTNQLLGSKILSKFSNPNSLMVGLDFFVR